MLTKLFWLFHNAFWDDFELSVGVFVGLYNSVIVRKASCQELSYFYLSGVLWRNWFIYKS